MENNEVLLLVVVREWKRWNFWVGRCSAQRREKEEIAIASSVEIKEGESPDWTGHSL